MLKQCQDSYSTQFTQFPAMLAHHEESRKASLWERIEVNRLRVAALDTKSPLYEDKSGFDPSVSQDAIADTAENLGLAIQVGGRYFPLRDTAYKSLLDRAKINGTALPKLARAKLAEVLNSCLELHKDSALLLIRDEKVSAAHSGDSRDYSILEIDQLLDGLQKKMDERFSGNEFETGYSDHAITSASWKLPGQKEDLLSTYEKLLEAEGAEAVVPDLMDFMLYCFYNQIYKAEYLGTSKKASALSRMGIWALERMRGQAAKAFQKSKHFTPPVSIYTLVDYARPIVNIGNQTGEGWFLTGEMVELIHSGVDNIVCTQPFGCLPNHVVGKGVIKELRSRFPRSNIVAIDYDPGASEVNQLNRIKLMLSTAQKNLNRKAEQ